MNVFEFRENLTVLLEKFNKTNKCIITDITLDVETTRRANEVPKMTNPNIGFKVKFN